MVQMKVVNWVVNWVVEKVSMREKPKAVAMAMWMDLIEVG